MTDEARAKRNAYCREWRKRNPDYAAKHAAKWRAKNPDYGARNTAKWRIDFPERATESSKKYAQKHAAKIAAYQKRYRNLKKEELRLADRKRKSLRYKTDPWFRAREHLRNRISEAIRESGWGKRSKTAELIGCSWEKLKAHLESLFTAGMSWENYGAWHVDHSTPCKAFNLCELEEQKRCMNWQNLQPLWAVDNLRKGAKIVTANAYAS